MNAHMSRAERNKAIEAELVELVALRGVTTAAVVDGDGFVTHIRRDEPGRVGVGGVGFGGRERRALRASGCQLHLPRHHPALDAVCRDQLAGCGGGCGPLSELTRGRGAPTRRASDLRSVHAGPSRFTRRNTRATQPGQ